MKTSGRNSGFKKHLRTSFSNENLWFYFGTNTKNSAYSKPKESFRSDFASASQVTKNMNANDNQVHGTKNRTAFIVDWQIY